MKRYHWNLLSPDDKAVLALSEAINVTLPVSRALFNRGIQTFDEAKEFFRSSIADLSAIGYPCQVTNRSYCFVTLVVLHGFFTCNLV